MYYGDYFADPTNYCGTVNGERFNQALPRDLVDGTSWNAFDGVSSDGTWTGPGVSDIDLDRNGVNDYTEHGSAWVKATWQTGQNAMRDSIRARYAVKFGNANAKLITYWSVDDSMCVTNTNGVGWEDMYVNAPFFFNNWVPIIQQWDTTGPLPRINYQTSDGSYDAGDFSGRQKDYFRFVRWGLCQALMHNAYFVASDETNHHWTNYYDEYDAPLGHPAGIAQQLSNGCWVRFFDNGVAIVNTTTSSQTVTSSDVSGLAGYAGPYYRFRGNQDTAWNNGSTFTSVTLTSTMATAHSDRQYVGDGIVLLRTPTTVVSDIIVDDAYSGTSPGSARASLTGFTWDADQSSPTTAAWYTSYNNGSDTNLTVSHYAAAGNGSSIAVFNAGINLSGSYKVYEWHGWKGVHQGDYKMATNVPCAIVHTVGTTTVAIDQSNNFGRWNLLGTFDFVKGQKNSATITNQANGYVVADAFKFEYVGPLSTVPGAAQPTSPPNGALEPIKLTLSWNMVPKAEAYDVQIATDPSLAHLVAIFSALPDTSCSASLLPQRSTYYWCVRTRNGVGIGSWSQTYNFIADPLLPSAPVVLLQSDGTYIDGNSAPFIWRSQPNADRYWYESSSDSVFSQSSVDSTLRDTTVTIGFNSKIPNVWWKVRAHGSSGWGPFSATRRLYLVSAAGGHPRSGSEIQLDQNYPNPFNPRTTIQFTLTQDEAVKLEVFDLLGRNVAVLVSGLQRAGLHKVEWDASGFPSSVYWIRLQSSAQFEVRKLILIK